MAAILTLIGDGSSTLRGRSLHLTRNLTSSMGGYLPNTLTELWEPSRDFAFLKLPTSGARCIVALSGCVDHSELPLSRSDRTKCRTMPHVMVISSEGFFYSYNIDLENGGECSLMKQYRFVSGLLVLLPCLLTDVILAVYWTRGMKQGAGWPTNMNWSFISLSFSPHGIVRCCIC